MEPTQTPTQEITLKELFERLVRLETLMGQQRAEGSKTTRRFEFLAILIIVIGIANIIVHIVRM